MMNVTLASSDSMPKSKMSAQIQKIFVIVLLVGFAIGGVMGVGIVWFLGQWNLNAPPSQQR